MYSLDSSVGVVTGIGPKLLAALQEVGITTIKDFLLVLPLHYKDYSKLCLIKDLQPKQPVTIQAEVIKATRIFKSRRPMVTATVADESGKTTIYWFNNRYVAQTLKPGDIFMFSGTVSERNTLIQPMFEKVTERESIHTNRLVPSYTTQMLIPQGTLRRILKEIIDNLEPTTDALTTLTSTGDEKLPDRTEMFSQLHFPDDGDKVIIARERLALEELLALIRYSHQIKAEWSAARDGVAISQSLPIIPESIPFSLTGAQERVISEILADLAQPIPMNRLLQGDVGSGKTVVAGIAAQQTLRSGHHAALIAPTKILAEQHFQTLSKLFPELSITLINSGQKLSSPTSIPTFWVGTHAVLNRLPQIAPALVIYDEQHRFGVSQRSIVQNLQNKPHVLTMTATPIPRTLLLTLFSHLTASVIDELPKNRIPTKTWNLREEKRAGLYEWLKNQIKESNGKFQALIVCPFIDPSEEAGFEDIAAATSRFTEIKKEFKGSARVGLLHGRQKQAEKDAVIAQLFAGELDIVVTTPIVEVGIDLPQASAMIIESAERYGMASLHQLRGRVGRAGQQGYCALFTTPDKPLKRLEFFAQTLNGQKLAELDLENRGAGDLFGTAQHGFSQLKYGNWTNLSLVSRAQALHSQLPTSWQSLIEVETPTETLPLAN
ncbi:ATP-dependent DNA helicase RecG [Candidatus Woesebacteria bacterium]|nr:ATP-dependent DNA helicase RecG [Candidatus Woesebacteria bacterium]